MKFFATINLLALMFASAYSIGCASSTRHTDGDADGDSDGDSDGDVDGDADGDADGDVDGDADGDVDGDADGDCPSHDAEYYVYWLVDDESSIYESDDINSICRVAEIEVTDVGYALRLTCETEGIAEEHVISIESNPRVWVFFSEGDEVHLRYIAEFGHDFMGLNRYFSLRSSEGRLLLAGVEASSLVPYDTVADDWYWPLEPRIVQGVCAPDEDRCSRPERVGISFTWEGMTTTVFSGNVSFASYGAIVGQAFENHESCESDVPNSWYRALFLGDTEG